MTFLNERQYLALMVTAVAIRGVHAGIALAMARDRYPMHLSAFAAELEVRGLSLTSDELSEWLDACWLTVPAHKRPRPDLPVVIPSAGHAMDCWHWAVEFCKGRPSPQARLITKETIRFLDEKAAQLEEIEKNAVCGDNIEPRRPCWPIGNATGEEIS